MREFELLAHVFRDNARLPAHVTVPPGDDMAVVEMCADPERLQLTVGVAVEIASSDEAAWRSMGRRAICGAGSTPSNGGCSVVGVVLPNGIAGELALALHAGLRDESDRIGVPIVGGDVAVSEVPQSSETVICAAQLRAGTQNPHSLLIACDSAIEGRHAPRGCDPFIIGRKAVLRNLSDVAAMGNAVPLAIAAGVVRARGCSADRRARLLDGIRQTAERWGVPLIAIDEREHIGSAPDAPLIACVAIVAGKRAASSTMALRSDARPGDGVYVTGTIGGAWDAVTGLGRHLDFTPRLAVAHGLCDALGTRMGAMIDVSDGLGRDLGHIASMSRVGIDVELAAVPVSAGCDPRAAIGQGEDYELVFTARGEVPREVAGIAVTRIGTVREGGGVVIVRDGDVTFDATRRGFEHDGGGVAP